VRKFFGSLMHEREMLFAFDLHQLLFSIEIRSLLWCFRKDELAEIPNFLHCPCQPRLTLSVAGLLEILLQMQACDVEPYRCGRMRSAF
jgi:hypothetical protein